MKGANNVQDDGMTFANPYIVCVGESVKGCGKRVTNYTDRNEPCGHRASFESVCPSWSPVDGCRCQEHLGHVPHGTPELP